MSAAINANLLWIAIAWPLLLAIPALHRRLPWPRYLAITPALLLVLLPGDASLSLPWLLFGTGFAVDSDVRWILAMTVAIWFASVAVTGVTGRDAETDHATPFFMLTLTGNLGAVLATDLVGFFSASTLMGYGLYGLLVQGGDATRHRTARLYLVFLVVADLALFEALLLAAFTTDDLRYAEVRQVMAGSASAPLYLWMALAAFALKAGVWPLHLWLPGVFRSAPLSRRMLLVGVPVVTGLIGALRWLPLGEAVVQGPWYIIQATGAAAVVYAALRLVMRDAPTTIPAWFTVAVTGLFLATVGTVLANPPVWHRYAHLAYPVIALVGISLAALTFVVSRLPDVHRPAGPMTLRMESLRVRARQWFSHVQRWSSGGLRGFQVLRDVVWRSGVKQAERILDPDKPDAFVRGWSFTITLLVLLGLAFAWLEM